MTASATPSARTNTRLMRVLDQPSLLPQGAAALCANYTSVTADLGRGVDALVGAGLPITSLLTPEHGYWGAAQAGESDGEGTDAATGLPVLDTYLIDRINLNALLERSDTRGRRHRVAAHPVGILKMRLKRIVEAACASSQEASGFDN